MRKFLLHFAFFIAFVGFPATPEQTVSQFLKTYTHIKSDRAILELENYFYDQAEQSGGNLWISKGDTDHFNKVFDRDVENQLRRK